MHRAQELADHAGGVLDTGDIERVHDMRVATRRLRAAMEVFEPCFPAKPYADTLRDVKRLADGLGERRRASVEAIEDRTQILNGHLAVEHREGGGTLVRVVLPRYLAATHE